MSTELDINELSKPERHLIRKIVTANSNRPEYHDFYRLYGFFRYDKFSESEIVDVVQSLVNKGFIIEENKHYSLTREAFIKAKKHYRWLSFFNSAGPERVAMMTLAIAIFLVLAFFSFLILKPTTIIKDPNKSRINIRTDSTNGRMKLPDSGKAIKFASDSIMADNRLSISRSEFNKLANDINSINSLLENSPAKLIELAALRRDVEELKVQMTANNEFLKRDIDRISSYNIALIAFMIAFLGAFVGLGIFRKNKGA